MNTQEIIKRLEALEAHTGLKIKPSNEVEKGKWYIFYRQKNNKYHKKHAIIYVNDPSGTSNNYGLDHLGNWTDEYNVGNMSLRHKFRKATKEEVKDMLIKEAKNRFGDDWENTCIDKCLWHKYEHSTNEGIYLPGVGGVGRIIWNRNGCIFQDGLWAERFEEDSKLIPLVNGEWYEIITPLELTLLQYNNDELCTGWYDGEYRKSGWLFTKGKEMHQNAELASRELLIKMGIIKEETPQVGDVCKFWDDDEKAFVVAIYTELREESKWDDARYIHRHGVRVTADYRTRFFKNAKTLTEQEASELLFGKGIND